MPGTLVISLDFELYWGVPELFAQGAYNANIAGATHAAERLLALFRQYELPVTWATVGAVAARNHIELEELLHATGGLEPREMLRHVLRQRLADRSDNRFFAPHVVDTIVQTPGQELASHSNFHTHALEDGERAFAQDMAASKTFDVQRDRALRSIVFPRNQFTVGAKTAASRAGISVYRPNPEHWFYSARARETRARRAARLFDTYAPLSGTLCRTIRSDGAMIAVPASIFYRPEYGARQWLADRRILSGVHDAIERQRVFHLWWHPHNFGVDTDLHMARLEKLVRRVTVLRENGTLTVRTMGDFASSNSQLATPQLETPQLETPQPKMSRPARR